jgi:hypothetical protein
LRGKYGPGFDVGSLNDDLLVEHGELQVVSIKF